MDNYEDAELFRWDAFLSFRGKDTRNNFLHRLYKSLYSNGIRTFRDNDGLDKGTEIASSLVDAIENSATFVLVISRNYATSTWCLDELIKILECGRLVLPVFYRVDPSDVRRQKGPFEEAFRCHEQQLGEKCDQLLLWKKALTQVGGICGWDSKSWKESEMIQSIVEKILIELSNTPSEVAKHPIRINSFVEEATRGAVYNKIVTQFDDRRLVSNTRTTASSEHNNSFISLRNKLIHDFLYKKPSHKVRNGITLTIEKIHQEQVHAVLDDVQVISRLDLLADGNEIIPVDGVDDTDHLGTIWECESDHALQVDINKSIFGQDFLKKLCTNEWLKTPLDTNAKRYQSPV